MIRKSVLKSASNSNLYEVVVSLDEKEVGSVVDESTRLKFDVSYQNSTKWVVVRTYREVQFFKLCISEVASHLIAKFPDSQSDCPKFLMELNSWFSELCEHSYLATFQLAAFLDVANSGKTRDEDDSIYRISKRLTIRCGYLTVREENILSTRASAFARKFVVLSDNIALYDNEVNYKNDDFPGKIFELDSYFVNTSDEPNESYDFFIHSSNGTLLCRASSEEDMTTWVKVLMQLPDGV